MNPYLTPNEIDGERWRWRQWKPQHGGWAQALWVRVQDEWRKTVCRS